MLEETRTRTNMLSNTEVHKNCIYHQKKKKIHKNCANATRNAHIQATSVKYEAIEISKFIITKPANHKDKTDTHRCYLKKKPKPIPTNKE